MDKRLCRVRQGASWSKLHGGSIIRIVSMERIQVFESVVPSERTVVAVKVIDSSVRAMCPTYPGVMVLHIGEADFSTAVVGNSPESSFHLVVQSLSLFLSDDLQCLKDDTNARISAMSRLSRVAGGVWKVPQLPFAFTAPVLIRFKAAGYALLAELGAMDFTFTKITDKIHPDIRVCRKNTHLWGTKRPIIGLPDNLGSM